MKLNAVLYMRYSTDMQTENSIDGQRRVNIEYAKKMGLTVIGEYIDRAISGKTDKRPEFQKMMKDIENGHIDINFVIVYKLDRFARNEDMHREYERQLNNNGVFILSATEAVNENNLASKVIKSLYLALNEEEVRKISENVSRGKKEAAYKGQWCGGPPPLGYDYDPKTKHLIVNEDEAKVVKLAFDLRAQGFSYSYIISELNKNNYKTKLGNEFGSNSLYDLFHNIKYKGIYEYNRAKAKSKNRHASKDDSEIIREPDENLRIVSDEVWDRVNEMSCKNSESNPKGDYLLSGLVKCKCGANMQVNKRNNKDRQKVYYSFFCPKNKNKKGCNASEINMVQVEEFVLSQLADKIFSDDVIERFIQLFPKFNEKKIEQAKKTIKSHEGKTTQNKAKIKKLLLQMESDDCNELVSNLLKDRITELLEENARLEHEIEVLSKETTDVPTVDDIMELKKYFVKYMLDNENLPSRKECLQSLIEGNFIYDDEVKVTFNL